MRDTPEHFDRMHRDTLMSLSGEERLRVGADRRATDRSPAVHGPDGRLWRLCGGP